MPSARRPSHLALCLKRVVLGVATSTGFGRSVRQMPSTGFGFDGAE